MSQFRARICAIDAVENLNIVTFSFYETSLKMMSLELPSLAKIGAEVLLQLKPTSVMLTKEIVGILSDSNKVKATVVNVEDGMLLSSVILDLNGETLESLITKEASQEMGLHAGDEVTAIFSASDLSIVEVLS